MNDERRRLPRFRMRCPVFLWKSTDGTFTRTVTENLTASGFFCLSPDKYLPGEKLEAMLELPAAKWIKARHSTVLLRCTVEVVRIDASPSQGFACRIRDFLVTSAPAPSTIGNKC